MFVAKHYLRVKNKRVAPGELLPDSLDEAKLDRLLRLGAIEAVGGNAPETSSGAAVPPPPRAEKAEKEKDDADPEENDEDAQPEVIDAMAGIVSAEETPAEVEARETEAKPKPKSKKKAGGGKGK